MLASSISPCVIFEAQAIEVGHRPAGRRVVDHDPSPVLLVVARRGLERDAQAVLDEANLSNAHGISLDLSDPERPLAWVPSRNQSQIKAFTLDGKFVEKIDLPGTFAGQLFFRDDKIYTAVCWSKAKGGNKRLGQSGFLLVLDRKSKRVISAPGGSEPTYVGGQLQPMHQTSKTFIHGHDLYVDSEGAIYLGEWNANRRYPTKLTPVK